MSLLSLRDLRVTFRGADAPAVDGVSLDLSAGEVTALVGESGSGKSVTAAAILGLLPRGTRVSGDIRFEGRSLTGLGEGVMCRLRGQGIGMIFQNPLTSLDPSFRIGSQLEEIIRHHGQARGLAARGLAQSWLDRVGIRAPERVARAWPHELSGGMRQRVMIALAILAGPRLLIADEPTTALDATIQKQILDLLLTVNRDYGTAILMITHDFGVVSYLAETVTVLKQGQVIEAGPVAHLLGAPRQPYTQRLVAAVPQIGLRLADDTAGRRLGQRSAPDRMSRSPVSLADAAPILVTRGLSKIFPAPSTGRGERRPAGPVHAVRDVSLTIRRGEIFGLVGESGSGKSTFARLVAQLIPRSGGDVLFDGAPVPTDAQGLRHFRQRFQFVFQDSTASLNPRRTVGEQIAAAPLRLGLVRTAREAMGLAQETLDRVGLPAAMMHRFPHEFSGGQRQRVGIARALALRPEFVVLDEPTSALDVSIQADILNLLLDLRQRDGLTYLMIGHNLPVIEFFCDRVGVMEAGELLETFHAKHLFSAGHHPSTMRLIHSVLPLKSHYAVARLPERVSA